MTNSVIITLVCAALAAWIAWLVYNYAVFNKNIAIESKTSYWKNRNQRLINCINDLIDTIHKKFPKSNVQYIHTDDVDTIEGEIKY